MSNFVLQRPTGVRIGTTASGYAAESCASAIAVGADLGSVRTVEFAMEAEILEATSTAAADAVVATAVAGRKGTLTIELEEITSSAHALIFGITASAGGSGLYNNGSATAQTYVSLVPYYWPIDGLNHSLTCYKCAITPSSSRKLSRDQEIWTLTAQVLVDSTASATKQWFKFMQSA